VIRTRAGYAGGTTDNPNYNNIGDHSETVRVDYDPDIVSYEELLAAFWGGHNATVSPNTMQYRSAIFYTTEEQRRLASASKEAEETRLGKMVYTSIEPYTAFYIAEDYHQKYYLRQRHELVDELYAIYPDPAEFRDSTTAARLNGYIGGYGDADTITKNLDKLGLSQPGRQALLDILKSSPD
jgi:peptide-methionine (S)-S-oxide reductase